MFENRLRELPGAVAVSGAFAAGPLSGFAESRLPEFAAVLSSRVEALGEMDQLELGAMATSCIATLDWLRCKAASSFALKDTFSPVMVAQRARPGAIQLRAYGGDGTPEVSELASTELALAWSCSETEAARLIAIGLDLRYRLRMTNHHFGGGRLTLAHARVVSEVTRRLSANVVETLEAQLAEAALTRSPARLRLYARRLIAKSDPDGLRDRAARAYADRSLSVFPLDDAMAAFCLNHQLETLAVIDDHLDAWGRQRHLLDPATPFDAHKADAAAHLLLGQHPITGHSLLDRARPAPAASEDSLIPFRSTDLGGVHRPTSADNESLLAGSSDPSEPSRPVVCTDGVGSADWASSPGVANPSSFLPARTELRVTMTADTLLGIDDATAELEGMGPITAAQARRLALESSSTVLRRVFCDPADDSILFLDAHQYRWRSNQAEAVATLHPYSTFPAATTPARKCDLDHRIPSINGPPDTLPVGQAAAASPNEPSADRGGRTAVTNAQPLSRRHHRAKTHGGWSVTVDPEDQHTVLWTSPYGRSYATSDSSGA